MIRNVLPLLLLFTILLIPACRKSVKPGPDTGDEVQSPALEPKAADATEAAGEVDHIAAKVVQPSGGLTPLEIELPRPMFVGTPENIQIPRLEKPLGKPRPPFLAPTGTVNVAAGKAVSGSDEEPVIGDLAMITDGDKDAADGSYVELGPFLQYVTIDLEQECGIYAIVVWHYHKQARVYFDVIVQVADDPDFIMNVRTLFNNDHDNSAGLGVGDDMHYTETAEGKLIDGKGQRARYVRLYSNGNNANDLNHYIEIDVYGKPAG